MYNELEIGKNFRLFVINSSMKTKQIPRSEIQYIANSTLDGQLKKNKPQFEKKISVCKKSQFEKKLSFKFDVKNELNTKICIYKKKLNITIKQ